mgnify:CR=1 FL=1
MGNSTSAIRVLCWGNSFNSASDGVREIAFVDQHQKRDLILAAPFEQNPNPGSNRARAKHEMLDVSLRVGAVGGVILQRCHC